MSSVAAVLLRRPPNQDDGLYLLWCQRNSWINVLVTQFHGPCVERLRTVRLSSVWANYATLDVSHKSKILMSWRWWTLLLRWNRAEFPSGKSINRRPISLGSHSPQQIPRPERFLPHYLVFIGIPYTWMMIKCAYCLDHEIDCTNLTGEKKHIKH